MDNYEEVLHQMQAFGIELQAKNLPLRFDTPKRVTCGAKGKDWYRLYIFRPDKGGSFVVGTFGTYRHGGSSQKVEVDWAPLSQAERDRLARERKAAADRAEAKRAELRRIAAMQAGELWHYGAREGRSPYLERKGLTGEACRYLPDGTIVILMLRYDLPRDEAIQAAQRILPDGSKYFTKGFSKPGCALRLGVVDDATVPILVVEGYATGLSVRMATDHSLPVYVAFDAGNLAHVVPMLRDLHEDVRLLICADDDWKTVDPITKRLSNPGRTAAKSIAKQTSGCDIVYPVFDRTRQHADTDFDDLRMRQGLDAVRRQLLGAISMMERVHG